MKIAIDISEETYNEVCWRGLSLCPRGEEELVKAIKKGTPLEQEPCGDCISREDALMALTGERTEPTDELIHRFIRRIRKLPAVTPAEKVGKWILIDEELSRYKCSECGEIIILHKKSELSRLEKDETLSDYPFSHCGCRMVEPQESEINNG